MRRLRQVLALAGMLWLASFEAQADSIVFSSYSEGVSFFPTGEAQQNLVFNGPANLTPQVLSQSGRFFPFGDQIGFFFDHIANAQLSGNATADTLRASASSVVSLFNSGVPLGGIGPSAFADVGFTATDVFRFSSATLPAGTPVSFLLAASLHSEFAHVVFSPDFDTTSPGNCLNNDPLATASLSMFGQAGFSLSHDSCGKGSNLMTFSGVFNSTVGGDFAVRTNFGLRTGAILPLEGTAQAGWSADASNTARISVQVLTPGVDFTADSGASYAPSTAPVPEPSSLFLAATGLVGLAGAIKRRICS